ncbi:hypothetical protein RvY_18963 [Ramazzottius varieornatus]|uniref:HTH CENPB-type domain-containing protein n=1 Tax=Ramazzottius varieornatus TaxID=947166 RepID=A0A1D1W7W8_RAMVA|nr:hypothetical protein RvY_18963 [Ramazzottius varieornatus]
MHPELDVEMYSKYEERLAQLKPARDFDLQRMALAAAVKLGITKFRASKGWVKKFRKRRGIVLRVTTKIGRKFAQADEDRIQERFFLHRIFEAVSLNQPHPYYIMNMDFKQTAEHV